MGLKSLNTQYVSSLKVFLNNIQVNGLEGEKQLKDRIKKISSNRNGQIKTKISNNRNGQIKKGLATIEMDRSKQKKKVSNNKNENS